MELDFDKLPRFRPHAMQILTLVPEWSAAHQVSRDAVINQIYIAHAWAASNPKKAPKKNMPRYLFNWMLQAKRYGNLKTPQPPAPAPSAADAGFAYDMTPEEMAEITRRNLRSRGTLSSEHKAAPEAL